MTAAAPPVAASVFGHRAFAFYWIGRIVSILSFQMLMVAIGWQLYSITDSALDLGFLGLAQFVPMLLLTLLVGHVADRHDYRHILLACQIGEAIAAGFLAVGSAMGWLSPWSIYAVVVLVGAARAFEIPTMVAIIPALVPRPLVPAATAWFTSANQAGQIIGPVLGGFLYNKLGPAGVYSTAIALWIVGVSFIAMIKMERPPRSAEPLTLAFGAGRLPLRAARSGDLRHHRARHVRGVPRRPRHAVSDLRPRHPEGRAGGPGPSARRTSGRRVHHVGGAGAPAADPADRPGAVHRAFRCSGCLPSCSGCRPTWSCR